MTRQEIKLNAADLLSSRYWPTVGVCFLMPLLVFLASLVSSATGGLAVLLLQAPITVGLSMYCLRRWRGEEPSLDQAFVDGFSNYGHVLGGYLWMLLFLILWSFLFAIPGMIKAFSYAMTPYLLGDCPNVRAQDALKLSMRMMKGHKWELFVFHLSFFGWFLLSCLTLNLLSIFYVMPYLQLSLAGYYAERKAAALAEGIITEEELSGAPIL